MTPGRKERLRTAIRQLRHEADDDFDASERLKAELRTDYSRVWRMRRRARVLNEVAHQLEGIGFTGPRGRAADPRTEARPTPR